MNHESFQAFCMAKPGVTASFPFNDVTLVFKVMGKVFALTNIHDRPLAVNLKCDPERAHGLREAYPVVQPGWHMNKRHWNTVTVDGSLPEGLFEAMVDHSYELVVKGLRRDEREKLERLGRMKAGLGDPTP